MGRKTKQDPTGQATNRKRATTRLNVRLRRAKQAIRDRFAQIPRERVVVNAEGVRYEYAVTPEQQQALQAEIRQTLDAELDTDSPQIPPAWFWRDQIEQPFREGAAEEVVQLDQLIAAAVIAGITVRGMPPRTVTVEAVLFSRPYRDALQQAVVRNYGNIKSLSNRTADRVIQQLNAGIQAGRAPREIASSLTERFDVAESSAERIATTEINQAYNDARIKAADIAADLSGLRARVMHISALLPTTRESHAVRHGRIYTTTEQTDWWSTGANRINCHCSTRAVLIDEDGNVVEREPR